MASAARSRAARFGGTETACILRIGIRLTTSIEQAATHAQTNHGDVHQPTPNCSLAASGPSADIAPAGRRRYPDEILPREGRLGSVVEQRVEPGQPQHD